MKRQEQLADEPFTFFDAAREEELRQHASPIVFRVLNCAWDRRVQPHRDFTVGRRLLADDDIADEVADRFAAAPFERRGRGRGRRELGVGQLLSARHNVSQALALDALGLKERAHGVIERLVVFEALLLLG